MLYVDSQNIGGKKNPSGICMRCCCHKRDVVECGDSTKQRVLGRKEFGECVHATFAFFLLEPCVQQTLFSTDEFFDDAFQCC